MLPSEIQRLPLAQLVPSSFGVEGGGGVRGKWKIQFLATLDEVWRSLEGTTARWAAQAIHERGKRSARCKKARRLDAVRHILLGNTPDTLTDDREAFYKNLYDLKETAVFQSMIGKQHFQAVSASLAQQDGKIQIPDMYNDWRYLVEAGEGSCVQFSWR